MKFEGVIPALVTPFNKNTEEIDYPAIGKITDRLIQQGIGGLFVCGSTGEWWAMTAVERMKVVDAAVAAAKGRTKIMVHCGANSTREAIALAQHAEKAGAQAISLLPPLGRPYAPALIWEHFRAVGASCSLPMYLYHLPQVYGDLITIDKFVEAIDKMPTLKGAKFSSYRIDDLIHLKIKAQGRLNILSGCAEQLLSATVNGAEGSICSWYNYFPRLGNRIIELAKRNEIAQARPLQDSVVEFGMLCIGNTMGNLKWLIAERGIDVGIPRRPILPTTAEEKAKLMPAVQKTGVLEWAI
jgi:dihydrodipicolinate synthase/N-acetylneuraminate lyase